VLDLFSLPHAAVLCCGKENKKLSYRLETGRQQRISL